MPKDNSPQKSLTLEPRTAQFFLSILNDLEEQPFGEMAINGDKLNERLGEKGLLHLFGESFLYSGRAVLFTGEQYFLEDIPLHESLKKPHPGIPLTKFDTYVRMAERQSPVVYNLIYPPKKGRLISAPLDTIVHIYDPDGNEQGVVPADTEKVAKTLLGGSDLKTKIAGVKDLLKRVPVIGYRLNPDELSDPMYRNVMRYVAQQRR